MDLQEFPFPETNRAVRPRVSLLISAWPRLPFTPMPEDEGGWDVESLLPYTPPSWVEVRGSSRGSFRVQCEGTPCLPSTGLKNRRRYVTHPARPLTARRIGVDSIAGLQWLVHERLMLQPNQGARASSAASQLSLLPIYTPCPNGRAASRLA